MELGTLGLGFALGILFKQFIDWCVKKHSESMEIDNKVKKDPQEIKSD
tara:strand:- start:478 stop:621 length:144 start_codon:yes stop_codon:yes gene_type:complete